MVSSTSSSTVLIGEIFGFVIFTHQQDQKELVINTYTRGLKAIHNPGHQSCSRGAWTHASTGEAGETTILTKHMVSLVNPIHYLEFLFYLYVSIRCTYINYFLIMESADKQSRMVIIKFTSRFSFWFEEKMEDFVRPCLANGSIIHVIVLYFVIFRSLVLYLCGLFWHDQTWKEDMTQFVMTEWYKYIHCCLSFSSKENLDYPFTDCEYCPQWPHFLFGSIIMRIF